MNILSIIAISIIGGLIGFALVWFFTGLVDEIIKQNENN